MPIHSNKQIFRLKVAIDDVLLVYVVEAYQYLKEVELSLRLSHLLHLLQLEEQLSAWTI